VLKRNLPAGGDGSDTLLLKLANGEIFCPSKSSQISGVKVEVSTWLALTRSGKLYN